MLRGMYAGLRLLLATALILPVAAHARAYQPTELRKSYTLCMNASAGYDGRILDCIDAEATYQDGLLNQAYRKTMARLTPAQRITLRNSERRWLVDRFAQCESENGDPDSGTMEHWRNNMCVLYKIMERTDWLESYRPR